jgi:hypothetical protein
MSFQTSGGSEASRFISEGKNAVSFCSAAHSISFKKDFSHCVEITLCKLLLDAPRNLITKRSTLSSYLLKSAGNRLQHRREKG